MAFVLHNKRIPFAHALDTQFETIFSDVIRERSFERNIFIVPTGRRVRLLRRTAIQTCARETADGKDSVVQGNIRIYTLEQFVLECARKIFDRELLLISEAYTLALMEEAGDKADLQFFRKENQSLSPAALERLSNIVLGLKEDGVTPDSLQLDIRSAQLGDEDITDIKRLSDIERLFRTYEALLGSNLADRSRMLIHTNEFLRGERSREGLRIAASSSGPVDEAIREQRRERWQHLLDGVEAVYIDGFSEFKPPEIDFLALLVAAPCHVRVFLDYSENNGPLFANLQSTFELLHTVGYQNHTADNSESDLFYAPEEHSPPASYLRRWLFNTERDIRNVGLDDVVQVWGAPSRIDEVRMIAREIKHLALTKSENRAKIPASQICVVMRRPEFYADLFREIFAEYDIPSNVTDRFSMASSPVTVAIFAVIDLALYGFRREDVGRALQNPYVSFTPRQQSGAARQSGAASALDGVNLLKVAQRLRIVGGHQNGGASSWVRRIENRLEALRRRRGNAIQDEDEIREIKREERECERALRDFSTLREAVPAVAEHLTPAEFAAGIKKRIIRDLGIRESILRFQAAAESIDQQNRVRRSLTYSEVEKDARAFTAFLELIEELAYIQQERGGGPDMVGKQPFRYFADRLRTAARARRYQVREKIGYGVTITSLEQIRNIPFQVTFICGLVDGEFPAVYVPESFLGKDLPQTEDRFIRSERMQFYQALTNAPEMLKDKQKHMYLTYPRFRGADELVRSPFIDALLKVSNLQKVGRVLEFGGDVELPDNQVARHAQQLTQAIGGGEELLATLGRHAVLADSEAQEAKDVNAATTKALFAEAKKLGREKGASRVQNAARRAQIIESAGLNVDMMSQSAAEQFNRFVNKPTSISALEQYAHCPYQFFADRILRLDTPDEFDNALSPLERGALLHRIMFRFYRELQIAQLQSGLAQPLSSKNPQLPVLAPVYLDIDDQSKYRSRLREIGAEEFEHLRFEHPLFDIEREEVLGAESKPGLLDIWLGQELKRASDPEWNLAPLVFEWGFGRDSGTDVKSTGASASTIPAVDLGGGLSLTGKIDRVDGALTRHSDAAPIDVAIIDYKSGKAVTQSGNSKIARGLALQMPLYSLVFEHVLREYYAIEATTRAAMYVTLTPDPKLSTRSAKDDVDARMLKAVLTTKDYGASLGLSKRAMLSDDAEVKELRATALAHAQNTIANIKAGTFPVEPVDQNLACTYCDFHALCRIREQAHTP